MVYKIITIAYMLGFSGILLHTQLVPGVPDALSMSLIVGGLATANVMQYRQRLEDQKIMRKDEEKFRTELKEMRQENIDLLNQVITVLQSQQS